VKHSLWLILLLGCGLDAWKSTDSGDGRYNAPHKNRDADADTDVDADTDTDITYPTDDMNSILLYNGHGGPDGTDAYGWGVFLSIIDSHWDNRYGWNTHWRVEMPDAKQLEYYRMIGILAPGATADVPFEGGDAIKLRQALDNGTRIVLFGDRGACGSTHTDNLLEELGVSIRLTGDGAGDRMQVDDTEVHGGHQVTKGVSSLALEDPCYVSKGDGTKLVSWDVGEENRVIAAAERPGAGGDVIIIGDFSILDDSGAFYDADNTTLVDNLATVGP